MSSEDFEAWFLSKHSTTSYNDTDAKWLRKSITAYSYHLQIIAALNVPLHQWLWLVNGTLLGLVMILLLVLFYLGGLGLRLKYIQRHVQKLLERIRANVLNNSQPGSGGGVRGTRGSRGSSKTATTSPKKRSTPRGAFKRSKRGSDSPSSSKSPITGGVMSSKKKTA